MYLIVLIYIILCQIYLKIELFEFENYIILLKF